jgi:hypothetical protein
VPTHHGSFQHGVFTDAASPSRRGRRWPAFRLLRGCGRRWLLCHSLHCDEGTMIG